MSLDILRKFTSTIPHNDKLSGDLWGGFASMLVALPSAIAFGVIIYAAIGPTYAGLGALAGILGATALGLIAPALGGTNRLITAPCAPAAAVLSAFAIESINQGIAAPVVVLQLSVVGLLTGIIQVLFGRARIGSFIKYIPYPVVSGYLSGVGIIIIGSQLPKFLGAPESTGWWQALTSAGLWEWQSIAIGTVTMLVMLLAPRVTRFLPAAILGLIAGLLTYFGIALIDESLLTVTNNRLVIGPLPGGMGLDDLGYVITERWLEMSELNLGQIMGLFIPALTLAVLLSIDTLKTCVVLDSMTRSSHDSNRELMAQGIANVASSCIGGMPGAGQMGATLVNLTSGGQTRMIRCIRRRVCTTRFCTPRFSYRLDSGRCPGRDSDHRGCAHDRLSQLSLTHLTLDGFRFYDYRCRRNHRSHSEFDCGFRNRHCTYDADVYPRATHQHGDSSQGLWKSTIRQATSFDGADETTGKTRQTDRDPGTARQPVFRNQGPAILCVGTGIS